MVVPPGVVTMIRDRVRAGRYVVSSHVARHADAERFGLDAVRTAVLDGVVIEWSHERRRILICARVRNLDRRPIWLHVVCDYTHPVDAGLVTAYVPDPTEWNDPPLQRR